MDKLEDGSFTITVHTKQFSATATKPARIKAEWRGRSKYVEFDPKLSDFDNHRIAAERLLSSLNKVPTVLSDWWAGALPDGWTFSMVIK